MSEPVLSVVVPTFTEAANIGPLIQAIRQALAEVRHEIVVVDDDSQDGTAKLARAESARVIVRKVQRGLGTAVIEGIRQARGEFVAVIDADFQHPPEALPRLLEAAIANDSDLVVGSRYLADGSIGEFGPLRRTISRGARTLARVVLPPIREHELTDPMSGLFLVRRSAIDCNVLRPSGYKILLEMLGRLPLRNVREIGFTFGERRSGVSKLGAQVMAQYLGHLAKLAAAHPDNRRVLRFAAVGLSGIAVNLLLLYVLHGLLNLHDLIAVPLAVEASILSNFFLNDRFTFHDRREGHLFRRLAKFNVVSLVALTINLATYAILQRGFGVHYLLAEFAAIVVAFSANYAGNLHWTYGGVKGFQLRKQLRRALPILPILLVGLGSGLVYFEHLDRVNEIYFDEHFYVSVARQIDNEIWEDPCWVNDSELPHRPVNYEHPPLAKLIMAWSVERFDTDHAIFEGCRSPNDTNSQTCNLVEEGTVLSTHNSRKECYDAFLTRAKTEANLYAWRAPSAIFGALTVTFAGLAGRRLFGSTAAGVMAGGLVLLDNLVYSSSRLAILDIYPTAFTLMAVWAATFPTKKGVLGAAFFLALGFACKYTVLFAGPPIGLLALWTQRRAGVLTRGRFDFNAAAFVVTPLAVWLATYLPWWRIWIPEMGVGGAIKHWLKVQQAAFAWGQGGYQTHEYASPPIEWFAMSKPTFYYHVWGFGDGREGWVYALGNPVLWWIAGVATLAALAVPVIRWVRALVQLRGWVNPLTQFRSEPRILQALSVTAVIPFATYAAFFLVDRVTFLFYMTLVVPLLALPLAGWLGLAWSSAGRWGRVAVVASFVVILAGFLWYFPVVSAWRITPDWHERIMTALPWMSYNKG